MCEKGTHEFAIIHQPEARFDEVCGRWFDVLRQEAPRFDEGLYGLGKLEEESEVAITGARSKLRLLDDESLRRFWSIVEGYDNGVIRMIEASRSAEDYRSTLSYCLTAFYRLIRVIEKLYDMQVEFEVWSQLDTDEDYQGTVIFGSNSWAHLRVG